jgi:Tfp pilus assembly protein PilV
MTIVELMVAMVLSSVVLLGLIQISTDMARRHFEGIRSGRVDSSLLYSLEQMNSEIESASVVSIVDYNHSIQGCVNYSPALGGAIDTTQPITAFAYCMESPSGTTPPAYTLNRYSVSVSGPGCAPSCAMSTPQTLVSQNVYFESANPMPFSSDQSFGGVDMHFIIGNPNSTPAQPMPIFYEVDTSVAINGGH